MNPSIAIVGGGPSGLFLAQLMLEAGWSVDLYEQKANVGNKFLLAGRSGLNLSHSEELQTFISRYGQSQKFLGEMIRAFSPQDLRAWSEKLGFPTFIGSSGRIFPKAMQGKGLLKAWLSYLKSFSQFRLHCRHRLVGLEFSPKKILRFDSGQGQTSDYPFHVVAFAMGGASWPKTGSDAGWIPVFEKYELKIHPFRAMNCGFNVAWSAAMKKKLQKPQALKNIQLNLGPQSIKTEILLTAYGLEGTGIYSLSRDIQNQLLHNKTVTLRLDLKPERSAEEIKKIFASKKPQQSMSAFLKSKMRLPNISHSLLKEFSSSSENWPQQIKKLDMVLQSARPLDEAISSMGGVAFENLNKDLSWQSHPECSFMGEMLDWDAPTGGYLLQACFSTAFHVAQRLKSH